MARRIYLQALLLASFTSLYPLGVSALDEVSDDHCDCYVTNGSSSTYFTTHHFFDFRSMSEYAGVPGPIEDPNDSSDAYATSDYFLSDDWNNNWGIQTWNNSDSVESGDAPVLMVHSANNIYIEENSDDNPMSDTFMTLRTLRLEDYQSSAEFESISPNYHYISIRMLARTVGASGAVTAMFTYKDSGDPNQLEHVQEADLEIRTMDPPDTIQYTNQPSYSIQGDDIPEATRNVTVPQSLDWTKWAVHRMDWTPTDTTWFIDGDEVASIAFQTPRDPSKVVFNAWSDGGHWAGNMSVGSEAYFHIQWIELVYNSTEEYPTSDKRSVDGPASYFSKRADDTCHNVCSIDETSTIGTAVLVHSDASTLLSHVVGFKNACFWIPLLAMTLVF
ncbi:concanavalin A-like lectin/glucanase domain-containing protein [Biscogniauxia sp. FL1348]|nr:concanavalin A-like lectin/glucanase domain-containing protein [Biscogniauxia sp. FL1348]